MNTVQLGDGATLAYRFDGNPGAPSLVLASSLGTTHAMWDRVVEALAAEYRVLRFDMRGHGASSVPLGAYGMDRMARDVIDLLDALAIEKTYFAGLSIGGMIGQWLGARLPDRITKLALLNTAAVLGPPASWAARIASVQTGGMATVVDAVLGRWFTADFAKREPAVVEMARGMVLGTPPNGYAGACAAIRDMDQRPSARAIRMPTLVIVGADDPATTVKDGEFLRDNIPGAKLESLPTSHISALEQPDAVSKLLLSFFRG